jgi:octaprenyl-diphosphate synthase
VPPSVIVEQVRGLVGPKVRAVETALVDHLGDCPDILRDAACRVFASGGKRLRPVLHLLSAELLGYEGEQDVRFATAFEYVHVASLLHDDVIDAALIRRGNPTLNQQVGNTLTVLVGDYLCMKALSLAVESGDSELLELLSRCTLELVAGEALQENTAGRLDLTEDEYLSIVDLKTARLMAACCEGGAILAGEPADSELRANVREFGLQLGMAFQLTDDILDFESDEQTLGKPVLNDLREGTLTLPAIHALREGGDRAKALLCSVLEDRSFGRVEPREVMDLIRETGGLDHARSKAAEAAVRARAALESLPDGPSRAALAQATEFAVGRKS